MLVKHSHTKNHWENLYDSYTGMFLKPGYPVDRSTKLRIDLIDEHKKPPRLQLYQISKEESWETRK